MRIRINRYDKSATRNQFNIHQRLNVLIENNFVVPFDDDGGNYRRSYYRYRNNDGDDSFLYLSM